MDSDEWRKTAENATAELKDLVFGEHNLGVTISPQEEKAVKDAYKILRKYFGEDEEEPDTRADDWDFIQHKRERRKK